MGVERFLSFESVWTKLERDSGGRWSDERGRGSVIRLRGQRYRSGVKVD